MTWKPFQQAVAGFDGLQNCDPDTVDCESTANDQNALVRATAEIEVQCGNGMNKIIKTKIIKLFLTKSFLTDTGEDSKFVHRRKRPKVDKPFSSLFSDASERRV